MADPSLEDHNALRPVSLDATQAAQADNARHAPGFWKSLKTAFELDSPEAAVYDAATREAPADDLDYTASETDWQAATKGIPAEEQDSLIEARSKDELFAKSHRLRQELRMERQLASAGWTGTSARVLASVVDPMTLAAIVGSDGMAAPWVFASKASRVARAVRAGVIGAGQGAALEGLVASQRETKGLEDVLIGALTGGAMSAPIGAFGKAVGHEAFTAASRRTADAAEQAQVRDMAALARADENLQFDLKAAREQADDARLAHHIANEHAAKAEDDLRRLRETDPLDGLIRSAPKRTASKATLGSFDELRKAMVEKGQLPESDGRAAKVEQVYRALTPERKQSVGRKEAHKLKARFDQRIQQTETDHAYRMRDAEAHASRLRGEADELQRALDGHGQTVTALEAQAERPHAERDLQYRPDAAPDTETARTSARPVPSPETPVRPDDSAGAASVHETAVPASSTPEVDTPNAVHEVNSSRYGNARISLSGMLKRDSQQSATLKWLADRLFADGVGAGKKTGEAVTFSAAEETDRVFGIRAVHFLRSHLPARRRWARDNGLGANKRSTVTQFNEAVTRYVRTGHADSEDIRAAGEAIRQNHRKMLADLKAAGVEGFEDVAENERYMTRQWLGEKFVQLNRDPNVGPQAIKQLLATAVRDATPDIDDDVAESLAEAFFMRFLREGEGTDTAWNRIMFGRDLELMKTTLSEPHLGLDDRQVDRIMGFLENRQDREQPGVHERARRRVDMNEDAHITLANGRELHLADLLENDAEQLHVRYLRSLSGHLAIARKLRADGIEGPINVVRQIERWLGQARTEGASPSDLDKFRAGFNMVLGRPPVEGTNGNWRQTMRFVTGWNFVRLMGQVGFAQVAEFGPIIGQLGWGTTLSRMPRVVAMLRRNAEGHIDDELMAEIEETIGAFGSERMLHQPHLHLDDWQLEAQGWGPKSRKALQAAEYGLARTQRLVADVSVIAGQTIMMQRLAATGVAQKFLKFALDPTTVNRARMRSIGLDDAMLDRVLAQVRQHHQIDENAFGSRSLKRLNMDAWDDLDARDAFAGAVHKWAYRMSQRNFVGELPVWFSTEWGKVLGQFRSFVTAAWEKQLLVNLDHADREAAATFFYSSFFAGLSYVAQTSLNSIGRDDQRRYLAERLSPVEIGKAAFQRAGYASLLPGMFDSIALSLGAVDRPFFAYGRTTGLATNFLTGNPTYDLVNKLGSVGRAVIGPARSDYDFSQKDFQSLWGLVALNNTYMLRNVGDQLSQGLPRQSIHQARGFEDWFTDE